MPEKTSFARRLKRALASDPLVTGISAVLAVVALGSVLFWNVLNGGVYLLVNVGVCIPYLYATHWPDEYSTPLAVAWTVGAAALTTGVYVWVYITLTQYVTSGLVSLDAFVATLVVQYAVSVIYTRLRGEETA